MNDFRKLAISAGISCALVSTGLIAPFGTKQVAMVFPMLPQEMVLAVWLIVKGFDPTISAAHFGRFSLAAQGEN